MKKFIRILGVTALSCGLMSSGAIAQDTAVLQKSDVNSMIETYIKENPQAILDSLEQFQKDQAEQAEAQAVSKLTEYQEYFKSDELPRAGNPAGDIQIVEFYDYNCGYCKRAFNDIQLLLEADKNIGVTFIEMPILGESSLDTAKWSMAAMKQGKFWDYHSALMKFTSAKSVDTLRTLAETAGLDVVALEAATNDEAILDTIEKNITVARDIGIRGTPGFVINGEIYRGYLGYDGMKAVIDEIRLSNAPAPTPATEDTNG